MKKILVPVDFSATSRDAMEVAGQLALKTGASLTILHVNEMAAQTLPVSEYAFSVDLADEIDHTHEEAYAQLVDFQHYMLEKYGLSPDKISLLVEEGLMIPVINQAIETQAIDLIVLGTHGAGGLKEMLIGSNAERIIRYAECPVLVIPQGVNEFSIHTVVVPTTLQSDQKTLFRVVKMWQTWFDFDIELVYLNNPMSIHDVESIEKRKDTLVEQTGLKNVQLHIHGLSLDKESIILDRAKALDAGLIVMATHQRRGLSHLLFGSLTEDTANHSSVPVLAVPAQI